LTLTWWRGYHLGTPSRGSWPGRAWSRSWSLDSW